MKLPESQQNGRSGKVRFEITKNAKTLYETLKLSSGI